MKQEQENEAQTQEKTNLKLELNKVKNCVGFLFHTCYS